VAADRDGMEINVPRLLCLPRSPLLLRQLMLRRTMDASAR
jgi:hypothetical protein